MCRNPTLFTRILSVLLGNHGCSWPLLPSNNNEGDYRLLYVNKGTRLMHFLAFIAKSAGSFSRFFCYQAPKIISKDKISNCECALSQSFLSSIMFAMSQCKCIRMRHYENSDFQWYGIRNAALPAYIVGNAVYRVGYDICLNGRVRATEHNQ